jgi:hypothetical protein
MFIDTSIELRNMEKELNLLQKEKIEIDRKFSQKEKAYKALKDKNARFLEILCKVSTPNTKASPAAIVQNKSPSSYAPNYTAPSDVCMGNVSSEVNRKSTKRSLDREFDDVHGSKASKMTTSHSKDEQVDQKSVQVEFLDDVKGDEDLLLWCDNNTEGTNTGEIIVTDNDKSTAEEIGLLYGDDEKSKTQNEIDV